MFFRPRFIASGGGGVTSLPIIHEDAGQSIQGGAPGEHYHLTADEYAYVQSIIPAGDPFWTSVVLLVQPVDAHGTTTFIDVSASAHTITTLAGAAQSNVDTLFGPVSIYLDGAGDGLQVASDADFGFGTGDFTIEWFMKPDAGSLSTDRTIISLWETNPTNAPHIYHGAGTGRLKYYLGADRITDGANLSTSAWQYFAVKRDAGYTSMWRGGSVLGGFSDATNYGAARPFTLADWGTTPSGATNLKGFVDQLRVTKGVARDVSVVPIARFLES